MIRRNSFRASSGGLGQKVTIRLLDDNEVIQVDFQPHHKGQFLMDYVCRQLNIAEKDYFGLRYVDSTKQRHWMDLGKTVTKQLKEMTPYIICFRFKFYPGDPMLLKEEVSRYQLVLQLRRDLLHGRLTSPNQMDIATLSSYIIQSELGDYDPEVHAGNYVAEYELVARQSADLEEKIKDLHESLRGVSPSEADVEFLKKAASLDTYGVDPHPVKDQQGEQLFLGINHAGISTFQGSKKLVHYKWSQITKLNYEAKMFIIHVTLSEDSRNRKKETAGFKCQTAKSCKYLWRCAVEQRLFFTCGSAQEVVSVRGGGLFGSRFRYSGKVQKEILDDPGPLRAVDGVIQRTPLYRSLQRNKTRSLSQSPMQLGYGSLPRSNHSAPGNDIRIEGGLGSLGSSASLPLSTLSSPFGGDHGLPMLETLEEDSSPVEDKEMKVDEINTVMVDPSHENDSIKDEIRISKDDVSDDDDEIEKLPENFKEPALDISESQEINESVKNRSNSTTTVEKRRKFGISYPPKMNIETLGNARVLAWSAARKQMGRWRSIANKRSHSAGDQGYEKLDAVEEASNSSIDIPTMNGTSEFPAFVSEQGDVEGDEEKILRESKITQVETIIPTPLPPVMSSQPSSILTGNISSNNGKISLSMWKIFVVCVICVLIALLFVAILAIEVDIDICQKMRKIPEVELFQNEIYEPVKYFVRDKINNLSNNIHKTFH